MIAPIATIAFIHHIFMKGTHYLYERFTLILGQTILSKYQYVPDSQTVHRDTSTHCVLSNLRTVIEKVPF
jgi:hypothetical protein